MSEDILLGPDADPWKMQEEVITPSTIPQDDELMEITEVSMTVKIDPWTGMLTIKAIPVGVFLPGEADGEYDYIPGDQLWKMEQSNGGCLT